LSASASERNKKYQKGLAFFETSDTGYSSEYGLYNSTGQLLKGNELFEQYSELAKQLDTKRSAFYLQFRENEIIFGCSLIVKAENGREERVVFIQVNKNLSSGYKIESNIQLIKQFYEAVKVEIESFELKKYQLIGLWNEGDFRTIKDIEIERGIKYTLGKISAGKKVSIKISELSSGLTMILELIARLRKSLPLIFDVSQYPSEYDVSVSLIKPNPDFEIGENGNLQNSANSESWIHYEKLGEKLFKNRSDSKGGQNRSNYIDSIVQMILDEPNKYCDPSKSLFNDSDDGEKVEIFKGLIQNLNKNNDDDIRKVLINIYGKIAGSKSKRDIHIILFSNNVYIEEIIKDLITEIYKKHNKDFFDILFNENTSSDNFSITFSGKADDELEEHQKWKNSDIRFDEWVVKQQKQKTKKKSYKYSFEQGVKDVLRNLDYSQEINFVKFIASKAPSKPEEKGVYLLESLINDLIVSQGNGNFILELNNEELERLGEILNADLLSRKKELKKKNRRWIKKPAFFGGLLIAIIFVAFFSYNPLTGNFLTGGSGTINSSSDNHTNNSKSNETYLVKADNNSSSDNQTNNSELNENGSGTADNNLTSDNQANNSELKENVSDTADNNLASDAQPNNSTSK
jgi:hypothetical protein